MIKNVEIGGKDVKLSCNAFMPILYKRQFGTDFFSDIMRLSGAESDLSFFNLETIYQIIWCMARLADKATLDYDEWLMSFDEFPIQEIAPIAMELLTITFKVSVKNA